MTTDLLTIEPTSNRVDTYIMRISDGFLSAYNDTTGSEQVGADGSEEELFQMLDQASYSFVRDITWQRNPEVQIAHVVLHYPMAFHAVQALVKAITGVIITEEHIVRRDKLIPGMREIARTYDGLDRLLNTARQISVSEKHQQILRQVLDLLEPIHDERHDGERALIEEFRAEHGFYPDLSEPYDPWHGRRCASWRRGSSPGTCTS